MSDIKLFRFGTTGVDQIPGEGVALERSLQDLFERNLESLLGVRFLASEFRTTDGRMDTLGIDENGTPVVIEYKRSTGENVISQGLFYLNWLMDHRKDFQWLVMESLGKDVADNVDWSGPRLICIAGDFTRYDEHAVKQMGRNIDLIRYRRFESDLLLLEQLTSTSAFPSGNTTAKTSTGTTSHVYTTVTEYMEKSPPKLRQLYDEVDTALQAFGDDVTVKTTDYYVAYRRIKNFACVEVRNSKGHVLVYAKVDPATVAIDEWENLRDVTSIGHYGTGDLEIVIRTTEDLARALPLLNRAYEGN